MSFKVEIEINTKTDDSRWCRDCRYIENVYGLLECEVFKQRLSLNNDYNVKRCQKCIDAEKQYKEKVNAKAQTA